MKFIDDLKKTWADISQVERVFYGLMLLVILFFLLMIFSEPAHANGPVTTTTTEVNNYYTTVGVNKVVNDNASLGMAASQTSLYYGSLKWQGSAGLGVVNDSKAIAVKIGRRPCKSCPLFSGTYVRSLDDESVSGYGFGGAWQF